MSQKHLLFVYGTLLEGYHNHHWIDGAEFVGVAVTGEKFTMYTNGSFPAVVSEPSYSIIGEVYEIDNKTLTNADRLEGYDAKYPTRSFYQRRQIEVTIVTTGEKKTAWIYYISDNNMVQNGRSWERMKFGDFSVNHRRVSAYA